MKKRFRLLLTTLIILLALCSHALAEGGFTLDESATIAGMNYLPWARGYEPTSDGETMPGRTWSAPWPGEPCWCR
mgnify:CR=1 FL=1